MPMLFADRDFRAIIVKSLHYTVDLQQGSGNYCTQYYVTVTPAHYLKT